MVTGVLSPDVGREAIGYGTAKFRSSFLVLVIKTVVGSLSLFLVPYFADKCYFCPGEVTMAAEGLVTPPSNPIAILF